MADEAEAAARSLADAYPARRALAELVRALTEVGDLDRAETVARSIAAGPGRSHTIDDLAGTCDPAWVKRLIAAALLDNPPANCSRPWRGSNPVR